MTLLKIINELSEPYLHPIKFNREVFRQVDVDFQNSNLKKIWWKTYSLAMEYIAPPTIGYVTYLTFQLYNQTY